MFIAAAVLSRRRLSRNSSPPPPPSPPPPAPPPPRHRQQHHRHYAPADPPPRSRCKPIPKNLPLVQQTTATEVVYHSRRNIIADDEYARATAARARLHARLRPGAPPVSGSLRSSSSVSTRQEATGTCKYSRKPRTLCPSDIQAHRVPAVSSKPHPGPSIHDRLSKELVYAKALGQAEDGLSDVCSICLESFSLGKTLVCLPCKHRFHGKCVSPWLEAHSECPNCRSVVAKIGPFRTSMEYFNALYGTPSGDFDSWVNHSQYKQRTPPLSN